MMKNDETVSTTAVPWSATVLLQLHAQGASHQCTCAGNQRSSVGSSNSSCARGFIMGRQVISRSRRRRASCWAIEEGKGARQ